MPLQRQVERLRRLRQHHDRCAQRYEEEITEKNRREHDKNLQLIKIMKRQKEEEQEEQRDCVTDGSLSESSNDLESDYVPMDSSEDSSCHKVNTKLPLEKKRSKLRRADTTTTQESESDEKISKADDNDKDAHSADNEEEEIEEEEEGPQITVKFCITGEKCKWNKRHYCVYCKKPQSKMVRHLKRKHSDEREVAQAICFPPTSKKHRQMLEGLCRKVPSSSKVGAGQESQISGSEAQDSDEEPDVLTQKTSTPGPSHKLKRTEKRGTDPPFLSQKKCEWSSEEKAAVLQQPGQYITLNRVPGNELCLKALNAEPILCHRDWRDVKNQVYNSITTRKRKRV
ncbi:RNA-binding protein 25-like [Plectropomus leopardus]|uniref:RNA-binding protein 25-like n=1 Tax=Plectropomus leopardus TaxID=160734 RepID=UPI001C4C0118|nr:RNA-binding protein 25-like [Plectropomus leopardus]